MGEVKSWRARNTNNLPTLLNFWQRKLRVTQISMVSMAKENTEWKSKAGSLKTV